VATNSSGRAHIGYREIADALRRRIDDGDLPPGGRVPGENELMETYRVEQPTARRALDLLKNEGLIIARRGSGTFVREFRPIKRVSPDRLRSEVWGVGRSIWSADLGVRPHAAGTVVSVESAPATITDVLGLEDDAPVVVRSRRFEVDGRVVQISRSYYPETIVRGSAITEVNTGDGGSYARLAELGHEPVRFREELRARMPREPERKTLALAQGTPVVEIVRTAYTQAGEAIEVNEMVLDASSYVIEYRFSARD